MASQLPVTTKEIQMNKAKCFFAVILIAFFVTGCSSPKDANKKNFKKAINAHLEKQCILISPRPVFYKQFPVTVKLRNMPKETEKFDALVKVGLLEVKTGTTQAYQSLFGSKKITVPTKTYSLSEKGKMDFKSIDDGLMGTKAGFCIANYEINEIINFSEPSQDMGYTVSQVNYTVSPVNIKDWASNPEVLAAFPRITEKLQKNKKQSATLVLMNDGWTHEKDME